MKLVPFKIRLHVKKPGDPSEVEFMGYEFLPGLFIHRSLSWETIRQTKRDYWDITHKSGYNICSFTDQPRTRKAILQVALKYLSGLSWTWDIDHLPGRQSRHGQAVTKVVNELEYNLK